MYFDRVGFQNAKTIKIITAPVNLPVTLTDMKAYLRVDTSDDNDLITSLIKAAASLVRNHIKRALITETLELQLDRFNPEYGDERLLALGSGMHTGHVASYLSGNGYVDLQFPPVQSITSITTYDTSNSSSVFSSSNYTLDTERGRVFLNDGQSWPTDLRDRAAIQIRYVAGYGDDDTDIPDAIRQAIRALVAKMYDCREVCSTVDGLSEALLAPYRLYDDLGAL